MSGNDEPYCRDRVELLDIDSLSCGVMSEISTAYRQLKSLPEIWSLTAKSFGNIVALRDPHQTTEIVLTYAELLQQMQWFAAGLQALGGLMEPGAEPQRIALFADNSPRWLIADQGIMMAGAANVVRGAQANPEELLFILADSGSTTLVVQDAATFGKLRSRLHDLPIQVVVLLSDETLEEAPFKIFNFSQIVAAGKGQSFRSSSQDRQTLATLLYTSGTTGKPKGVMLSHGNLLHQVIHTETILKTQPGERVLSILPTWHSYERSCEYFLLSRGCTQIYTNLRSVKKDLKTFQPRYMVGVPRLWESIYEGIQKQLQAQPDSRQKLAHSLLSASQRYHQARRIARGLTLTPYPPGRGQRLFAGIQAALSWPLHALAGQLVYKKIQEATGGQLKCFVSGGGSLAMHLENFFEAVGIEIIVGYGLTETSPILSGRLPQFNIRGSSGRPLPETELRIVHPETRKPLPTGEKGLVLARGTQIMQGYYGNPQATAKAIDPDGWFDTGDLGWMTAQQDLVLTGRAKDTIVLTNGENIEPQPIEDACQRSLYIDQIMLVGQDRQSLGALIVPNLDALQQWASTQNCRLQLPDSALNSSAADIIHSSDDAAIEALDFDHQKIQALFKKELLREVKDRPGYRPDDRIGPFRLLLEPFAVENGMMTQTLKIRRPVVRERYRAMIDGMFD